MAGYWSESEEKKLDGLFDRLVVAVKESERPDMDSNGYLEGVRMAFKVQLKEIAEREADDVTV